MKSPVTWALAGAAVVLLGFGSLQLTDAAWSASDSSAGDTVRTGHLRITGAGQMDLDVSGLAMENMNTGDRVQIPLTVYNDSTIPVGYALTGVVPSAVGTPGLDLRVARVANEGECPAGKDPVGDPGAQLYSGPITGASMPTTTLAVDASDVLCLTATAQPITPGESGTYVFTFRADQQ